MCSRYTFTLRLSITLAPPTHTACHGIPTLTTILIHSRQVRNHHSVTLPRQPTSLQQSVSLRWSPCSSDSVSIRLCVCVCVCVYTFVFFSFCLQLCLHRLFKKYLVIITDTNKSTKIQLKLK